MKNSDRRLTAETPMFSAVSAIRATIDPLHWESEFFNLSSGKLNFSSSAPVLTPAALARYALTQAKIPANNLALADALANIGFRLVEGEVDLCLSVDDAPAATVSLRQRLAERADIPQLRQAAAQVFSLSRFRAPWYQPTDSGRFYARWIENAVLGAFDDLCLLVEDDNGQPQGWVTIRQSGEREARIGLLGVFPGITGRGVGSQLMALAETWCRQQGIQRLRIATQVGNVAALRLYLRRGARIERTAYWLYR